MSVQRTDFADFFAALHNGHKPFRWQVRLLDHILHTGQWPDQLVAPTGAGKTSVIDIHVFAVAMMGSGHPARLPRRLALIVDRRVLVDDQYEHAKLVSARLADARGGRTVLARVASALDSLRLGQDGPADSPLRTALLRGGVPPSREWLDDPVGCAVLCATPDMWGSRLLLAGYGSRRQAWPREAGLLAYDTVAVVDEAHLSQQLLTTARRVAQLAGVAEASVGVPILQVVETTATPRADAGVAVGVEPSDLEADEALRQRLTEPKPVTLLPLATWPLPHSGPQRNAGIVALADEAVRLHEQYGSTVGCFVNTVAVAAAVRAELQARGRKTELVCGRMRPFDVARLRPPKSSLLSIAGDAAVDILVSTQSLEVGVDLDLAAAVTELAPGSAIAQRAGRVNRLGQRSTAVTVVVPSGELPAAGQSGPYQREDLAAAQEWLSRRQLDPAGLAPWALVGPNRPPVTALHRDLLQRLELAQAWHLARTSDDLAAPQDDLDLWLSEKLEEPEYEIGIVVRRSLPTLETDAVRLMEALPPRPHEVFPVSIRQAGQVRLHPRLKPGSVLVRPSEDTPRPYTGELLRPGDVLVIDDTTELFTAGVFDLDGKDRVDDVLEALDEPGPGEVVLRVERDTAARRRVLDAVSDAADNHEEADPREIARLLLVHREELTPKAMVMAAASLLDRPQEQPAEAEVRLHWEELDEDGKRELVRLIVVDLRMATADAELRQEWTPRRKPVTLRRHAEAVAQRAEAVAARLGLDTGLANALKLAGLHHDDGKADERFQRSLRAGLAAAEPLAKSGVKDTRVRKRLREGSGLPTRWRHEQLSISLAWPSLSTQDDVWRDLAARLVGTSHGHGRHSFPHTSEQLVPAADQLAVELFDEGLWDELIERTQTRWGVWGCAYLEALLRAADGQVSAEGS